MLKILIFNFRVLFFCIFSEKNHNIDINEDYITILIFLMTVVKFKFNLI